MMNLGLKCKVVRVCWLIDSAVIGKLQDVGDNEIPEDVYRPLVEKYMEGKQVNKRGS